MYSVPTERPSHPPNSICSSIRSITSFFWALSGSRGIFFFPRAPARLFPARTAPRGWVPWVRVRRRPRLRRADQRVGRMSWNVRAAAPLAIPWKSICGRSWLYCTGGAMGRPVADHAT
jgi:hypothetical protein